MFKICDRKGFHITYANGWTVSVQFGGGNYGSNYDAPIGRDVEVDPAEQSEVAAWPSDGGLANFSTGDTVDGYYTADEVLRLMQYVSSLPRGATNVVIPSAKGSSR